MIHLQIHGLVLFLIACPSTLVGLADHVTYVDSSSGHDNATCLQSQRQPCQTLEYVQSQLKTVANESVVIEICGPVVNLTRALHFKNFSDLSIRGSEDSLNKTEIFCNTSYSGLSFANVTRLSLSYIQLTNCGLKENSTIYDISTNKMIVELSALYMLNCRDVYITNTVVYRSYGTGISMLDTNGNVLIEHTNIVNSTLRSNSSNNDMMFGGSGLHIEFSYCTNGNDAYGHLNCTRSEHYSNANYTIHKCNFTGNQANATQSLKFWYNIGPMGSGGGAHVGFAMRTSNVSVTFNECIFQTNSAVMYGGGLKLQFYNTAHSNQVSLVQTRFLNNSVHSDKMGGGLQISFSHYTVVSMNDSRLDNNNSVTVKLCNFSQNSGGSGGGVNVFSAEIPYQDELSAIIFTNCTWTHNRALYGAAVHIMPATWASEYQGRYPRIGFINSRIISNVIMPTITNKVNLQVQINGAGAFFCSHITVTFARGVTFVDNNGTALYLSGSAGIIKASSVVLFHNNSGINGGGVSLMGRSFLLLNGSSNFYFTSNQAKQLGGGMYFHSTGDSNHHHQPCFIYRGLHTQKSVFVFDKNHAYAKRGHHIYASSFTSCGINCPGRNLTTAYKCIGDFTFSNPHNDTTATLPTNFNLKANHGVPITVIPGFTYHLPLVVKDAAGHNISNISYEASVQGKSSVSIDSAFKYVSNNTIKLCGKQNENASLHLDTLSTDFSLVVNITLAQCPPGYALDESDNTCKCRATTYYGIQKCDPEAYIRYGVWMGKCNKSSNALCTADCPVGYCSYNVTYFSDVNLYRPLPLNTQLLEPFVCSEGRNGTICGQCTPGHSVYFNSWYFECGRDDYCHLGPLFFVLAMIIPLTILFIVITVLDTNIAGNWNGLIFFFQMVYYLYIYANGTIRFPDTLDHILNWLMFIYSFFNLEIFNIDQLSFCMWKGAGVMDILMVKLGTVLFSLALVMSTVFILNQHRLTRCFPCLVRRRYSVINGISAFFILCYAQCTRTCFQVLATGCVYDENYECSKSVILHNGNMSPFQGEHIKYATVAVVFLIFIVILPPVLLLFYPLFFKMLGLCGLSESKYSLVLWKMMPIQILDSFQNPFKDNYRFFAGFYFLYRAIALALYAMTSNLLQFYSAIELELLLVLFLHALFNPYKRRLLNIIDLLLIITLAIINGITLYNYILYTLSKSGVENDAVFWITLQIALLLIPLTGAGLYLLRKLTLQLLIHIERMCRKSLTRNGYEDFD